MEDVLTELTEPKQKTVIRDIDKYTTIRTGKYGDYVFHKVPHMSKPVFFKLHTFTDVHGKESYKTCDVNVLRSWLSQDKRYRKQATQATQVTTN